MKQESHRIFFYIFFLVGILLFSFFSLFLSKQAIEIEGGWPERFLYPIVSLVVLGVLFSLAWLVLGLSKKSKYFLTFISLLSAFWMFFFVSFRWVGFWPVFVLALVCLYFASRQADKEKAASLKINISRIFSLSVLLFYTGLVLIVAFFYYQYQANMPLEAFRVSPNITRFIIDQVDKFLSNGKNGQTYFFDMDIDEYLKEQILEEGELSEAQLKNPLVEKMINEQISTKRQELNEQYELQLTGQESIAQLFTAFITAKINQIIGPYRKFVPLALAFGLFIALRAIGFLYVNLVIGLTWILFKLMLALGIVKVEKVMAEKEIIKIA